MKKLREWGKTLLIYLLIAAAVLQTVLLWDGFLGDRRSIFERIFGEETPVYEGHLAYEQLSYALDVLQPLGAAVRVPAGGIYAAPGRNEAYAVFEKASLLLGEALESAGEPSLVTSGRWQELLDAPMILVDFGGTVKLETLAHLMGVGIADGLEGRLRWLMLSGAEGRLWLCYRSEARGIYVMPTTIACGALESICGQYEPGGGFFAYERGLGEARDVLLMKAERTYPVLTTAQLSAELEEAEYDRMLAAVLEGLGFNSYTVRSYTESDGTKVYVEDERVARLTPEGKVSFTDMMPMIAAGEPDVESEAMRIGEAARFAESVLSPWLGDAGFYLMEAGMDEESGEFVVTLGLTVSGEKVVPEQGFALRAAFRGSRMVTADFVLRSWRFSGQSIVLMPAEQALAAGGCRAGLGVYYVPDGTQSVMPGWYVME